MQIPRVGDTVQVEGKEGDVVRVLGKSYYGDPDPLLTIRFGERVSSYLASWCKVIGKGKHATTKRR